MGKRFYVDTSAYLCLLLGETGAAKLQKELAGAALLSSVLLVLEARRNLIRLARDGILAPQELQECLHRLEQDVDSFLLRDLTLDLCVGTAMPVVSTPRSLDLAHLETALWYHRIEPVTRFLSLDDAQLQGARELGLPV